MKKIIYLLTILSIVLVGCESPCQSNPNTVTFLKVGFEEKKDEYYIRVEGSKELGILYGNLVQYPCINNTNKYNIVAIDVSYFSPITEGEYNKHNGLISAETITLDTILTY
jgi:hypothetical protein